MPERARYVVTCQTCERHLLPRGGTRWNWQAAVNLGRLHAKAHRGHRVVVTAEHEMAFRAERSGRRPAEATTEGEGGMSA